MDYLRKNKLTSGIVVVLILFNIATVTMLWLGKNKLGPRSGEQGGKNLLKTELGLSEAQAKQVEALQAQHFKRVEGLRKESRDLRGKLHSLWKQENSSEEAKKIAERLGKLNEALELSTFEHFSSMRKLLKEDQKGKFDKIITDVLRSGTRGPQGPPPGGPNGRRGQGPRGDQPPPNGH